MNTHRVVLKFDDGVYATLICPETGCKSASVCSECHRSVDDTEIAPCYDCPPPNGGCWVKTWFDNCMAEELLHGEVTVDIDARWDGDAMTAHIVAPVAAQQTGEPR
jgi:hypothetical protein